MKIVVSSDWHLDAVTAGVPRIDEFDGYVMHLVDTIKREKADVFLHLGDFFDPGGMLCSYYTTKLLWYASEICASVDHSIWIAGNHDVIETQQRLTTISPLKLFLEKLNGYHTAIDLPSFVWTHAQPIGFLILPYMARSAWISPREAYEESAVWKSRSSERKLIVAGHLTVPGAKLGSETYEIPRGRDVEMDFDGIDKLDPAIVLNGHYHDSQEVDSPNGVKVVIPGSPQRIAFGEREHAYKGCLVIEI